MALDLPYLDRAVLMSEVEFKEVMNAIVDDLVDTMVREPYRFIEEERVAKPPRFEDFSEERIIEALGSYFDAITDWYRVGMAVVFIGRDFYEIRQEDEFVDFLDEYYNGIDRLLTRIKREYERKVRSRR
jgi:hypothetical protein